MKLIFFDFDGVLTPTIHAFQLAEMVDRVDEFRKSLKKVSSETSRELGLEWLAREVFGVFTDIPESPELTPLFMTINTVLCRFDK